MTVVEEPRPRIEHGDEDLLKAYAGRHFFPGETMILPSGGVLDADESQVLTSYFAPTVIHPADRRRNRRNLAYIVLAGLVVVGGSFILGYGLGGV